MLGQMMSGLLLCGSSLRSEDAAEESTASARSTAAAGAYPNIAAAIQQAP